MPNEKNDIKKQKQKAAEVGLTGSDDAIKKLKHLRQERKKQEEAKKIFFEGKDIHEMAKQEITGIGLLGKIAHRFFEEKKLRAEEQDVIDRLINRAKKGEITREQLYGGLLYVRDHIGKTRYKSRLDNAIEILCEELQRVNPQLKNKSVAEGAMSGFKQSLLASGSFCRGNSILEELKRQVPTEKTFAEALKQTEIITNNRRNLAVEMIATQSKLMLARKAEDEHSPLREEYDEGRSLKSKFFQNKSRAFQLTTLENTIWFLNTSNLSDGQKAKVLIGCLYHFRDLIQAEKPKDPTYLEKSSFGKIVIKMMDTLELPKHIPEETAKDLKETYRNRRNLKNDGSDDHKPDGKKFSNK